MSIPTDARTLLRGFLVIGGVGYAAFGLLEGTNLQVAFGGFAALLGGFGLWWDHRESADES